ncbi:MAG: NFACT RNA binding domain-containing protein [Acutalibacteraceae bacterium]|nr:NFACT RNA binding domain-containing protein [Acutalibacteraceae bacterium]
MPLDGITLNLLKQELSQYIIGSRIEKIHQPSKDELVFHLRSREGAYRLLISASANSPRLHLTANAPENPATPPMLCMLFRKHLTGAVITDIRQLGLDRVIFIDLSGTNEIGDAVTFTLCVEIMAKHSNIVLINSEGNIIDAVKRVDFTQSSVRQILPTFRYEYPPRQGKMNITEIEPETAVKTIKNCTGKHLSGAILETLEGISPLISREIASFSCGGDIAANEMNAINEERLTTKLHEIKNTLLSGNGNPTMLIREGVKPYDFTFMDITQYGFTVTPKQYESFSELLDNFYYEKDRFERTRQRSQSLLKLLTNASSRAARKLQSRQAELEACADRDTLRIYAELILANQYRLEKGSLFYDLENFYDNNNTVRIPADPALSPSANAQKYFKEYRKAKTAESMLGELIEQSEQELAYLESVIDAVNRADGYTELAEIRNELYEQGYLKRAKNDKSKKPKPLPPLEYVSDDGYTILVGRNNVQNDLLTFKTAAKDDSWFHTQKIPGSHVVVIGNGDIIPELTCRQAATLAAYHSGGRESSQVAVDYTEVRSLKKPTGAKPGKVIYHTYNTMWVTPDRELCERLKKK